MTEKVGNEIPGEGAPASQSPVLEQAYEDRAKGLGWKPQEDFSGDPADWRPAKEFLDRQPLFDKIHSLKNELFHQKKSFEQDLDVIKQHVKQLSETEYKKALSDIKLQRRLAVSEGDVQAVDAYDTQIEQLQTSRPKIVEAPKQAEPNPIFIEWADANKWYSTDQELRQEADTIATGYVAQHQGRATTEMVLNYVKSRIEKMYPEKFAAKTPKQEVASVESGGASGGGVTRSSSKLKEGDLSEQERHVMNTLVKRGVLTKADYIKQLEEAKARG